VAENEGTRVRRAVIHQLVRDGKRSNSSPASARLRSVIYTRAVQLGLSLEMVFDIALRVARKKISSLDELSEAELELTHSALAELKRPALD
jgi:hypothetical protein